MTKRPFYYTETHPKTLLVAVHSPLNPVQDIKGYFDEFIKLVETNHIHYDEIIEIKLRIVDRASFFTAGKLEELVKLCTDKGFEEVIISEPLSIQQERILRELLHCKVFDRTALILDIFDKRATSAEGKIQVKIARLRYQKGRLSGRGTSYSQQGGSIGTRGPGETQKEKETQHIEHLMVKLRRELAKIEQSRQTQRKQRLQQNLPLICLFGYTNSGKSTLLNALTHSSTLADNQLFATLDTTTRKMYIDGAPYGLLSDTIGFIQELPPQLIDAFKSTLHELRYAHLLLHVVDISHTNWKSNIALVNRILADLNLQAPLLYILNKADRLSQEERDAIIPQLPSDHPFVFSSALHADGLKNIIASLTVWKKTNRESLR